MRPTLKALAQQQKRIESLEGVVAFIADAAGLSNHPRVTSMMKKAADENPGSPNGWAIDGQGGGTEAPAQTTEEARANGQGTDSPEAQGTTPGTDVTPAATTSLDSTEVVLDTPLDLNEQDPTKQVAGTDDLGEGARGQAGSGRTETEVRSGTPSDTGTAFSETGWTNTSARSESRSIASLRLARLRMQAGIEPEGDDIALSTTIASSEVTDEAIQGEIDTLAKVVQASRRQPVVASNRALVPQRTARTTPSMVSQPEAPMQTVASGPSDDEFGFE